MTAIVGSGAASLILMPMSGSKPPFSLYIHVPFCKKKCDYCHFFVIRDTADLKKKYLEHLHLELELRSPFFLKNELVSIYFGGGTPSLLTPHEIGSILSRLTFSKEIEVTLEVNPETVTFDLMREFREVGINRISLGIQSLDDHLLQKLSREHDAKYAMHSIFETYRAGFENISIDLMYDIPFQTLESWKKTFHNVQDLPITHLSLYNLTIEPHTVFYKKRETLTKTLPDEKLSFDLLTTACEKLEEMGLKRYEISAFARPSMESKHNCGYWTARPFIGCGPSAFSYWEQTRFRNVPNLNEYCERIKKGELAIDYSEKLGRKASEKELLALRLRLLSGIPLESLEPPEEAYKSSWETIEKLIEWGLLEKQAGTLRLSQKGILFYDTVAIELIEEAL